MLFDKYRSGLVPVVLSCSGIARRYFGGDTEHNSSVVVVKRYRFPRVFRFYRAFVDQKRGNSLALDTVEATLYADPGLTETS